MSIRNTRHSAQLQEGGGLKQRRTPGQKLRREVTAAQASCSEAPMKWRQPKQEKNVTPSVKNTAKVRSEEAAEAYNTKEEGEGTEETHTGAREEPTRAET